MEKTNKTEQAKAINLLLIRAIKQQSEANNKNGYNCFSVDSLSTLIMLKQEISKIKI